jgi:hypothetical protein
LVSFYRLAKYEFSVRGMLLPSFIVTAVGELSFLDRHGLDCRYDPPGNWNAVERIFREVKRRTTSFSNTFSHVEPATAESSLQALAVR